MEKWSNLLLFYEYGKKFFKVKLIGSMAKKLRKSNKNYFKIKPKVKKQSLTDPLYANFSSIMNKKINKTKK